MKCQILDALKTICSCSMFLNEVLDVWLILLASHVGSHGSKPGYKGD